MWDQLSQLKNNVERFAGDRLKDLQKVGDAVGNEIEYGAKQVRDRLVVPAIDAGMEAGVIPAAPGMYGRYLTGTEVPLTRAPAGIKEDEAKKAQQLSGSNVYQDRKTKFNSTKKNLDQLTALEGESITVDEQKIKDLLAQQSSSGINIRDYRMGVGATQDPTAVQAYIDRESQIRSLQSKWPNTSDLGGGTDLSTNASEYDAPGTILRLQDDLDTLSNYERFKDQTPSNYTSDTYSGTEVMEADATTNTLGRYEVKDGVITDRYNFDYYQTPGEFNTGGIVGANDKEGVKDTVTRFAGSAADKLGLIKPGSGYDVRIKVR